MKAAYKFGSLEIPIGPDKNDTKVTVNFEQIMEVLKKRHEVLDFFFTFLPVSNAIKSAYHVLVCGNN